MTADESALYALATRLLPRRPNEGAGDFHLISGQLPADLPVQLPVPPAAQIIGAVVEGYYVTVLLDTGLSPKQALAFYGDALYGGGWSALDTGRSRGGFEQATHSHGTFCRSEFGPKISVNAHAYPEMLTQVRLDLDLTPDAPCEYPGVPRPSQISMVPSLPELAPPAGAILRTLGGEASPIGTSTQAQLITPLDLAAVAAHYANQMHEAGCIERDRGQGELVAWSTWELDHPDHGPSQGLFLALRQVNDPAHYFLYERVAWISSDSLYQ